ncbi:MAG: translation initiation factor IF-3 [Gemmatimonadota bacterium]
MGRYPSHGGTEISDRGPRVNEEIRISPVRVIGATGDQLGILSVQEALAKARSEGLDLVEVAPQSRPPVCRIMDYGKYKYEQARKARQAKKKQHQIELKEIKFRPKIEEHDIEFKLKHARRFLEEGNKVKLTLMFRGREAAHPELGEQVLQRVVEAVSDLGQIETHMKPEGRTLTMVLAPRKK